MKEVIEEDAQASESPLAGGLADSWPRRVVRPRFAWAVTLVLLLGFVLRFWGVNWDQGTHLHPDERFITMVATDLRIPDSLGQYFNSDK